MGGSPHGNVVQPCQPAPSTVKACLDPRIDLDLSRDRSYDTNSVPGSDFHAHSCYRLTGYKAANITTIRHHVPIDELGLICCGVL